MKNLILFIMFAFLMSCTAEQVGDALFDAAIDSVGSSSNGSYEIERTGNVNCFHEEPGVYLRLNYPLEKYDPVSNVHIKQLAYTSNDLEFVDPSQVIQSVTSDKNGAFTMTYTSDRSYTYFVDLKNTSYNSHTEVDEGGMFKFVVFNSALTTIKFKSINPSIVINDNLLEYSIRRPYAAGSTDDLIKNEDELVLEDGDLVLDCAVRVNYIIEYRIKQTAEWKTFNLYRDENIDAYEIWID